MKLTSKRQLFSAILMALALASPLAFAETPAPAVSWLFVEDAAGGTITGPDDQHLKLKLNKVRKYITEFTDRPNRQAFAVPNADFFTDWPQMFAGDPPNAVLSYSLPSQSQPLNIVLTLTNPQYDALKRTVSYDAVRILQATDIYLDIPDLAPFQTHKTPQRFGKASLFIDPTTTTYAVGDTGPAGGIVFYLTPGTNGLHGLEAAPADQSRGIQWACNQCGTGIAASIAASYSLNGFHDWYLPSKDELNLLYAQKTVVGGFVDGYYWSSWMAPSQTSVCVQNFSNGEQGYSNPFNSLPVRAVRAF